MTNKRYTADDLRDMVRKLHYSGTDEFSDEAAEMLAQAAEDRERLARIHALSSDPKESFEVLIDAIERESRDKAHTQEKAND